MPFVPFSRTGIELPVSDRQLGDTLIRQKARFLALSHSQDSASGVCMATIKVEVTMYAADGAGFGPALSGAGFSTYTCDLIADNKTVVDATTGAILAIQQAESQVDWQATLNAFTQPVMLQGDFFEYLRENQAINIGDLIRQHIQNADQMGRFA